MSKGIRPKRHVTSYASTLGRFLVGLVLLPSFVHAETIVGGDVTAELGPDFFIDEAVIGGGDTTTASINLDRDLGSFFRGREGSEVMMTGLGWASSAGGTTATEVTATITYLGADGVAGGGDDVVLGSQTDALVFAGAGEYRWRFDTPVLATIDGSNSMFRIRFETNGSGVIRFKNLTSEVKLSVAGTSSARDVENLALYRKVTADSNPTFARYATDGVVGSDFKWIMSSGDSLPQYLEIEFPGPVEMGSFHLYHGVDNANIVRAFRLETFTPSGWAVVPGTDVSSNTDSENNVIFPPITATKLRLRISTSIGDGRPRIREWAVFPYHGGTGYPLGRGVTINMAQDGRTESDSTASGRFARLAVDGTLDTYWQSDMTGPHTFEVYLRDEMDIKYVHLHSGESDTHTPISDFTIEYSSNGGSTWTAAPGGVVTGNTQTDRAVAFSSDVFADAVRLVISDPTQVAVRELQVFPNNGIADYPLFSNTKAGRPPSNQDYEIYSDSTYRILSAVDGRAVKADGAGSSLVPPNDLDPDQVFNVLLNAGYETYRFFNRSSRDCLGVDDASLSVDAPITEEPYTAFPSQQWHIRAAGNGLVYIQNVFSGLFLEAVTQGGDGVVQRPLDGSEAQKWHIDFQRLYPKKGSAGFAELADDMGSSWFYGWTANDLLALNTNVVDFNPMQWGNFNWDPDQFNAAKQLPLTVRFPDWVSRGYPFMFMGFNEPDKVGQANISVETAVLHWPKVMASGLPLVSPVTAQVNGSWMVDFMTEADTRGFQVDYLAMHTYVGPFPDTIINSLNGLSAAYDDKPVLLTEFGFSDFGDTQNWTEIQLYRALLELLWRLEAEANCKRYSLFGFVEDAENPQPAEPTGRARRSNWKYTNGDFTPIGELYMGWDGDLTPNPDQAYILHSRAFDMRVSHVGTPTVEAVNIRTADSSAQVVFESIGNGFYYMTSLHDGSRLRQTGPGTVEWAPSATTSSDAQWSWSNVELGWQLITNRGTGDNLRYTPAQGVHMGTDSGQYYHWWMIPPMGPVDTIAPGAPTNATATPSHRQVDLAWVGSVSSDLASYTVKRGTSAGGPFTPITTNLVVTSYPDAGLTNDLEYFYIIEAVDRSGNAGASSTVSATPVAPLPDTYSHWAISAFDGAPEGTSQLSGDDPEGDGMANIVEYLFLLDPLTEDPYPVEIFVAPAGDPHLSFDINRHATDVVWNLHAASNLFTVANWTMSSYAVVSQSDDGDLTSFVIAPVGTSSDAGFFTIGIE